MTKYFKTLKSENSELYAVIDNRRMLLARCRAEIKLYEHSIDVPALGRGKVINKRGAALMVTFGHKPECSADESFVNDISRLQFQGDILRTDGSLEQCRFDNCLLDSDLDLTAAGECRFELRVSQETLDKLKAM